MDIHNGISIAWSRGFRKFIVYSDSNVSMDKYWYLALSLVAAHNNISEANRFGGCTCSGC